MTENPVPAEPVRIRCPKCKNEMLEDAKSSAAFICLRCEGVWLRTGELEQFLRASAEARGLILGAIGLMESPPTPSSVRCPDCANQSLETIRYRGIEVERCPGCRGTYADAGEREQIAQRVLNASKSWD